MKNQIVSALIFAGLIAGAAFGLKYLAAQGIIPGDKSELSNRILQVSLGLIVAWMANMTPKRMAPLGETNCDPASEQSRRRFVGLAIMIGGLLYALAWLAAPSALAFPLSIAALGGAVLVALVQCFAGLMRRS